MLFHKKESDRKESYTGDREEKEELNFESPTPLQAQLLKQISKLRDCNDGGKKDVSAVNFSKTFQDKLLALLDSSVPGTDFEKAQKTFQNLLKDATARSRLDLLHTARGYKYGFTQFGPKNWYKDSQFLAKRLKTQADRRKFRQGLKADIEFINFLNVKDVEELLSSGDSGALKLLNLDESIKPSELFSILDKVPLMSLLKLWNVEKAKKLEALIQKISDALHFSFSMTDYFAHDDALEPALAVVCQMLRSDQNLGSHLRQTKSSFLSLAQCYQKHRSPADKDFAQKRSPGVDNSSTSDRRTARPNANPRFPYKLGLCFDFQKERGCQMGVRCKYTHECDNCASAQHGSSSCPN